MYIEYITPQRPVVKSTICNTTGGDYRPTWLLRVSDWKKVPGYEATNGYHTLSYCWEQSGEMVKMNDGEYILKDDGHHKIKTPTPQKHVTRRSVRYRKKLHTRHVSYEGILRQLCKDFDIDYLWYDKVCIDQTNKEEKRREIKEMHLVYSNARFTVALIPEVCTDSSHDNSDTDWMDAISPRIKTLGQVQSSLWWKRSWTLEELMMSTQILILGRDTHLWCLARAMVDDTFAAPDFMSTYLLGFKDKKYKSANMVLNHAHFRTSTKDHDKVFALANIFKNTIPIDVNYDRDVSTVMKAFYQKLAQHDLSVMCFGSILDLSGKPFERTTMNTYDLPSWTGFSGSHMQNPVVDIVSDQGSAYTIDDTLHIHIRCRSFTIRPPVKYENHDVFVDGDQALEALEDYQRPITSMDDFNGNKQSALNWSQAIMNQTTNYLATHYWEPDHPGFSSPVLPMSLTEDCDECVVPAILFKVAAGMYLESEDGSYIENDRNHLYVLPVLTRSTKSSVYKAVGTIVCNHFMDNWACKPPEQYLEDVFGSAGGTEYKDLIIR